MYHHGAIPDHLDKDCWKKHRHSSKNLYPQFLDILYLGSNQGGPLLSKWPVDYKPQCCLTSDKKQIISLFRFHVDYNPAVEVRSINMQRFKKAAAKKDKNQARYLQIKIKLYIILLLLLI